MGWDISEQGFRIVLSAEVPDMARDHLAGDVDRFLADHGLARADVASWVCHPGGPKVLAAIEEVDGEPIDAREKLDTVARFIIDSYRHEPDLMKVIIVDVTRAAYSFGRTHLPEIRRAYEMIAKIVADGQRAGTFRRDVDPEFASMWFYGAIEQLLSGWVFDLIPGGEADFDRAREMLVETICGGLDARDGAGNR